MTMPKIVTIDEKTLAGNPWLTKYIGDARQVQVPEMVTDADGGAAFYISQLAGLETRLYAVPYADITYLKDIGLTTDIPEYATHWNYRSYDGVTLGKFIGANASDLPRVAQSAQLHKVELGYAGVECHYSLDELRTTSAQNMPIDSMQSELAYRGSEEHSQRVAYFGDTARGMAGLFNNTNVTTTSPTKAYSAMTGQELFDAVNDPIFTVMKLSKYFHIPNTVLMFPDLWKLMNGKLMSGYTDRTVMEHFQLNNAATLQTGQPIRIEVRFQLSSAERIAAGEGASAKDRVVIYEKNDRNLALAKPIPFRLLAPQLHGLGITVPAEYKISGTEFRYPLSAIYLDAF